VTMPAADVEITATYASTQTETETLHFREGGGTGYVDVTFDDTWLDSAYPSDTHGTSSNLQVDSSRKTGLICIKDLFTELPATTNGLDIVIESATLHVFRYQGSGSVTVSIYRCTTDWLPDPAGSNENDCNYSYKEASESTSWANGSFSSSDYDTSTVDTGGWTDTYNEEVEIDVSDVMADLYDAGVNYGMVVKASGAVSFYSAERSESTRVSLEITYHYGGGSATTYTLTVNSGSGDGSYSSGTIVNISADAAPSGQVFDEWTGDTADIADVTDPTTTITMPASDAEITATYENTYTLTVNSGSGDGSYAAGTVVNVSADAAPSGQQFDQWVGDTSNVADVNDSDTTITMPSSDAEITATYESSSNYTLTVNSGSGDGNYSSGAIVNISADAAPSGKVFDQWTGDTSGVADVSDPTTTFTMPAADAEITATYEDTYSLTVNSGSGDGSYAAGAVVDISADSPPSGKQFDAWIGDTSGIANVSASSTTITMSASDATITATYEDVPAGNPSISGVSDSTPSHGQSITISGSNFGSMGGSIISWDDFEDQSLGGAIHGSSAKIGAGWSCQYNYSGLGARWDDTHTHSGDVAAHIEWGYPEAYSIRAFGWAGQGPFSQIYISYWRYMEGDYTTSNPTCNHKQFYLFGNNGGFPQGMPLMPAGTSVWGFYINNSTPQPDWNGTNNINTQGWTYYNTDDVYQRWEFWCKLNDPYTAYNGVLTYWKDGVVGRHRTDYRHRFVDGEYTEFRLGHMAQQFTDTAKAWFDDLYIASTQARVELGNNSSWSSCTHREIQIPTSWSSNSITVDFNQGTFGSGTAYLFVVDADGNASAGYAVTTN